MLDVSHRNVTALDLEKQFGTDFTAEVLSLPDSKWSGPVRSVYGLHLVKVFDRIPGRMPELAEVRETVESDLMYEVTRAAQEQGYQEIAGKYRVRINNGAKQMLAGETQ
jgi:parvulin-like peptidyl-prolyl isomerase